MREFEYVILGAGAIGSIIGAHLAKAGHSVAMLVRDRRGDQIRRAGLRIRGLAEITVPVAVVTCPSEIQQADVLVVAMKTPGTAAALEAVRHANIATAFSIQNGMWKNEALRTILGSGPVIGSLADISGEQMPDGEVLFTRNVNLLLGELTSDLCTDRAQRIARSIDKSGVRAAATCNMRAHEWTKFVSWAPLTCLALTTRAVTWRYLSDPHAAAVIVCLVREVARVVEAQAIELVSQPSLLPVSTILQSSDDQAIAAVLEVGHQLELNAPDHRMSVLQDLAANRALEVHETLGHAANLATRLGVSVPLLENFYRIGAALDSLR